MKEQITGKTTWGTGIWESKRKLNKWVLHRWVTGLFRGSSRVMYVWVKPWAEAEQFGAAHHLGLGLGQVLGMLQTVKGQSYIHQATANAGGHKWNAWCSLAACLRGLMPFPPINVPHLTPHCGRTYQAHCKSWQVHNTKYFKICSLFTRVWVDYMHVLFLNKWLAKNALKF